jgi:hypothetical protein
MCSDAYLLLIYIEYTKYCEGLLSYVNNSVSPDWMGNAKEEGRSDSTLRPLDPADGR